MAQDGNGRRLQRDFYERAVEEVARDLLGCLLVHRVGSSVLGGAIVETEAYGGPGDPGSHADRSPNGRARVMFGRPGVAYVYFTYGMHYCMNAVTGPEGVGSAVLIRAVEPRWGVDEMRAAGFGDSLPDHKLTSGPGRLCRALQVGRQHNGADMVDGPLTVLASPERPDVVGTGPRVGLSTDDGRNWRFWTESPSVSRWTRGGRRASSRPG